MTSELERSEKESWKRFFKFLAEDVKQKMSSFSEINWSGFIRKSIEKKVEELNKKSARLTQELEELTRQPDPDLNRNCMVEIRGGTGGQEASLFAADLYRMYTKYAVSKGWIVELMDIKAKLVIIGDGIAGLSLAYIAAQRGIRAAVLGKNLKGTTHSATGLIAPRPDYLLSDSELVRQTSVECLRFAKTFGPEVLKRRQFLIPTYSGFPVNTGNLNVLLSLYDEVARSRFDNFERHDFISSSVLEKMEPNLRKNRFGGVIPKSVSFTSPFSESKIFCGEMSRWTN